MKASNWKKTIKFSLLPLVLFFNVACVITPNGDVGVVGGVGVDLTPQIIYSDSSYVTVRVGPSFYASDAYLLAYNYCLGRGLYPYAYSSWAHSASSIRDLRYDCRSNYIAPPTVYNIDRRNRYRYDYFNNYYYKNHRPGYHYQAPTSGWWGKNNNRYVPPTHPPQVNPSPGYSRDGRAVTPQSPWSYNNGKNNNRYQPRSGHHQSSPNNPSPSYSTPSNPVPTKNTWWGKSSKTPSHSAVAPTPKLEPESPKSKGGSFWGGGRKSDSSSNPRYESAPPSSDSSYSPRSPSHSGSGSYAPKSSSNFNSGNESSAKSDSSKPGWWGKK
jgi:hypothetical protein